MGSRSPGGADECAHPRAGLHQSQTCQASQRLLHRDRTGPVFSHQAAAAGQLSARRSRLDPLPQSLDNSATAILLHGNQE